MTTTTAPTAPLTISDRCDRCGARAYLRVTMPGGGELLFCAHHGRTYETALREQAIMFEDQREKLNTTSGTEPADER